MRKAATSRQTRSKSAGPRVKKIAPVDNIASDSRDDMDEKMSDEEIAAAEDANLLRLLSKPEEALNIKEEYAEEEEVVTICPRCKVEEVFIDNTCPNCGFKKKGKGGGMDRYGMDDDIFSKNDFYVNYDEE